MSKHGNTGNQHAVKKEGAATATIHIRCTPSFKNDLVKKANINGQTLSEYIIEKLS